MTSPDAETTRHQEQSTKNKVPSLWSRYQRLPRNVVAIGLVSLLNDASSEIIYPLLPVFLTIGLGASATALGLIEGLAETMSSLLKLFAGYLSDRFGKRKWLVVGGYALASVVRPFLGFAGNWQQVLAIRLADRVGKGIRTAPRDAMIADTVAIEQRGIAFGFHRAMDHAGAVVGPLIGFSLVALLAANSSAPTAGEFTRIFLLASIPAMLAVFVAIFFMRETTVHVASSVKIPKLSLRGFDGNFKRFLVIVALFTLSSSSDSFLILRALDSGVSIALIPLLWAAHHGTKVLSSLYGGDLSDRLGRKRLIVSGWILYAVVYAGFAFVGSEAGVWALFLVYGVYFGLVEGVEKALVADLVRPEQRGTAYGLYNLAFGITVFPASLLMGMIWDWKGPATAFLISAVMGVTAAALLLLFVRPYPERITT
ncbi:MAG: MFS transporter [Acidobacteria bacterium]|nr:MFS transporter [Acidobacteriota bacterium]MCA1627878.1 MFS transporter [Acidobacteriota bacterium]